MRICMYIYVCVYKVDPCAFHVLHRIPHICTYISIYRADPCAFHVLQHTHAHTYMCCVHTYAQHDYTIRLTVALKTTANNMVAWHTYKHVCMFEAYVSLSKNMRLLLCVQNRAHLQACLHVGSLYVLIRKTCVCVCVFKTEHTYKHVCMLETYMSLSKKHVFVFVCLKQGTHVFVFVCLNQGTCT